MVVTSTKTRFTYLKVQSWLKIAFGLTFGSMYRSELFHFLSHVELFLNANPSDPYMHLTPAFLEVGCDLISESKSIRNISISILTYQQQSRLSGPWY